MIEHHLQSWRVQVAEELRLIFQQAGRQEIAPESSEDATAVEKAPQGTPLNAIERGIDARNIQAQGLPSIDRNIQRLDTRGKILQAKQTIERDQQQPPVTPPATPLPPESKPDISGATVVQQKNFLETARDWTAEQMDVSKWSNTKKAIVATTVIGLGAVLLWKLFHRKEEKKDKGDEGGFPKWLLWIPVLGLGAWGAYEVWKKLPKDAKGEINFLPGPVQDTLNVAGDTAVMGGTALGGVAKGFTDRSAEVIGTAMEVPVIMKSFVDALSGGDTDKAWEEFKTHGGIMKDNIVSFYGNTFYKLPEKLVMKFVEKTQGKGAWTDVVWVYGELGASYLMARGTLELLLTGKMALPTTKTFLFRSLAAPLSMAADVGKIGVWSALPDGRKLMLLHVRRWKLASVLQAMMDRTDALSGNPARYMRAFEKWARLKKAEDLIHLNERTLLKGLATKEHLGVIASDSRRLSKHLQDGIKKIPVDPHQPLFEEIRKLQDMNMNEHLQEELDKLRTKYLNDTDALAKASSDTATKSAPLGTESTSDIDGAKIVGRTDDARKVSEAGTESGYNLVDDAIEGVDDAADTAKAADTPKAPAAASDAMTEAIGADDLAKAATETVAVAEHATVMDAGDVSRYLTPEFLQRVGKTPDELAQVLRGTSTELLEKIGKSAYAQRQLAGALEKTTKQTDAVARVLKQAEMAGKLRVMQAVGIAGDALGVAMAVLQAYYNSERIKNTDNKDLKELYGEMYTVFAIEGGVGAAGVGATAYTIVTGAELPALGLLVAPAALVAGGAAALSAVESTRETFLTNVKDYLKKTPTELYKLLEENKRGTLTMGDTIMVRGEHFIPDMLVGWAVGPIEPDEQEQIKRFKELDGGRIATRSRIIEALIILNLFTSDPPRENEMTRKSDGTMTATGAYFERIRPFVRDQLDYVMRKTHGWFDTMAPETLKEAESHAALMQESRALADKGETQIVQLPNGATLDVSTYARTHMDLDMLKKASILGNMSRLRKSEQAVALGTMIELKKGEIGNLKGSETAKESEQQLHSAVQQILLQDVSHLIARHAGRIESHDFGWCYPWGHHTTLARYALYESLRGTIRAEASQLIASGGAITPELYAASINRITASMQKDPADYLDISLNVGVAVQAPYDSPQILTPQFLASTLDAPDAKWMHKRAEVQDSGIYHGGV